MPKAEAVNGSTRACMVLIHSSWRIRAMLPISVTSKGRSKVAMNSANRRRLNGKRKKAKA